MSDQPHAEAEILNAALDRPAQERAAYLDGACAGNPALRQQLEELIRSCEQFENFLEVPLAGLNFSRAAPVTSPLTEKLGDRIGRYKLFQQIGEGGCGVVYRAEQEEPVRRFVALKVIKLGMDTKSVIARFEAERQALALMDHPHIAKVLDAGATETGRPYFVMELVRGIKITEFCDKYKVSTEERLKLFIQVCQAIQHAHQKGIIHRDIKPSNILVTVNDGMSVPKVIDFGIAKATQGKLTDKTLFTAFEQFIGTPSYMSPEQAEMTSLDVDTRSDIYSLGVLLYELLTGCTPFNQKELLALGLDEMRRIIRQKEPPKPSTRLSTMLAAESLTAAGHRQTEFPKLIHRVSGDLDWIVMKALEKDRTRRYETANGFATDIGHHLNNQPVGARPPSRVYRVQKLVRRNKLAVVAATAVVATLVIGLAVSTTMFFKAEAEKKKAQTEAAKSKEVAQFLKDLLNGAGPAIAQGRDPTMLREILDKTAERVGRDLKKDPEAAAELWETIGYVYGQIGPIEKNETMQREALAIWKNLPGDHESNIARALRGLAGALWRQGNLGEAEITYRAALTILKKWPTDRNPQIGGALAQLGGVLRCEGKLEEAELVTREAVQLFRNANANEDLGLAKCLDYLGQLLDAEHKFAEAETALRESLDLEKSGLGTDTFLIAGSLQSLGMALHHGGKLIEAETALREALEVHRNLSDQARSPYLAWCLRALAQVNRDQNQLEQAEDRCREALNIERRVLGHDNPDTILALQELVDVLNREGKQTEAKALLESQSAPAQN